MTKLRGHFSSLGKLPLISADPDVLVFVNRIRYTWAFTTNEPPTADAGLDQSGDEGDLFTFVGSGSSDTDGTIVFYDWDFGDGGIASGVTATHAYADNGTYTVTLTVTDDEGATDTDTAIVTVANVAPTAVAGGPYSGEAGTPIAFTGSVVDPGSADTHTFAWDFGDGTTATGQTVSHAYSAAGGYTATLTVTDKDGGVGTDTATVTVTPASSVEPPSNLRAQDDEDRIEVEWEPSPTPDVTYNVYRRTEGSSYGSPISTGVEDRSYEDENILPDTYYYVVTAVQDGAESSFSNEASATTVDEEGD